MTNEASIKSLIEKTINSYHRLDYAFNNAGIEQIMTPLTEQTLAHNLIPLGKDYCSDLH